MIRKISIFTLIALFALTVGASAELSKTQPIVEHKLITGNEELPDVAVYPYVPGTTTDSPGIEVGTTYYDYQTNGSSGNRIAVCTDGSIYFDYMNLLGWPYPPAPRHVYHNWMDASGTLNPNGFTGQVNTEAGSGYTNMDIIYGTRGAFAYHSSGGSSPTYMTVSVDFDPPGLGFFDHYNPPDEFFPQDANHPGRLYWPYVAVDMNNNIHVVGSENSGLGMWQRVGYTRSTDGGATWSSLALVDTVMVISAVVDASPVSSKVVVADAKSQDLSNPDPTQWNNDIYYYVADDGMTWDFQNGHHNITGYNTDNDSLWAYTDLDIIIDYNDNVHVVWTDQWVTDEGIYYRTNLKHYTDATDEVTEIFHHPDSLWTSIEGAWNRSISKMNLGASADGGVFVTWTQFDTSDVSAGGFGNGDIYMTYTYDNGVTWGDLTNLTASASPGCYPGQCDSDHWSTLADVVDDNLHLLYINDKDAGGIPQTEGAATENPVKYLEYPTPGATGVEDNDPIPTSFALDQNYPNPFNAKTIIDYSLENSSKVKLEVFDITGAKVTTLVDGVIPAGNHQITWDAASVASGVYFYKLSANNEVQTKQMVLVK